MYLQHVQSEGWGSGREGLDWRHLSFLSLVRPQSKVLTSCQVEVLLTTQVVEEAYPSILNCSLTTCLHTQHCVKEKVVTILQESEGIQLPFSESNLVVTSCVKPAVKVLDREAWQCH